MKRRGLGLEVQDTTARQPPMVAYFGLDCTDHAVIKRIDQFRARGYDVVGATFRRPLYNRDFLPDWNNIDLGTTQYYRYFRRVFVLIRALWRLFHRRSAFGFAVFFYARNLDNALLALFVRRVSGSHAPLVYEILDVSRASLSSNHLGAIVRWAERFVLRRCRLLVVSSPNYIDEYFRPRLEYRGPWFLLENKMPRSRVTEPAVRMAALRQLPHGAEGRWVIGWFGLLDCQESWNLLKRLAAALPDRIEILLHGIPVKLDIDDFHEHAEAEENISFEGEFRNPDDLPDMYRRVDLVWTFDFTERDGNSEWLLPNSLYEGGFFGKPLLARLRDATGAVVARHDLGWVFDDPVGDHVEHFLSNLSRDEYLAKRQSVAAAPSSLFVETDDIGRLCEAIIGRS